MFLGECLAFYTINAMLCYATSVVETWFLVSRVRQEKNQDKGEVAKPKQTKTTENKSRKKSSGQSGSSSESDSSESESSSDDSGSEEESGSDSSSSSDDKPRR